MKKENNWKRNMLWHLFRRVWRRQPSKIPNIVRFDGEWHNVWYNSVRLKWTSCVSLVLWRNFSWQIDSFFFNRRIYSIDSRHRGVFVHLTSCVNRIVCAHSSRTMRLNLSHRFVQCAFRFFFVFMQQSRLSLTLAAMQIVDLLPQRKSFILSHDIRCLGFTPKT